MSAKLINSNAKEFLQGALSQLRDERLKLEFDRPQAEAAKQKREKHYDKISSSLNNISSFLFDSILWNESDKSPQPIGNGNWDGRQLYNIKIRGRLFLFKNALFDVTGLYSVEEASLLVQKKHQKARSEIEFLKTRSDESPAKSGTGREHVPEHVRNEVWRRDGGKCVECGSVYNLEFDHAIPVAKGGSNTARNLRILCEPCNRRKSANIG